MIDTLDGFAGMGYFSIGGKEGLVVACERFQDK